MNKDQEWETFLRASEYPFVRPGMGPEEFKKEKRYYWDHYREIRKGTYKPLWQQSQE